MSDARKPTSQPLDEMTALRQRIEESLQESETLTRAILATATDAIIIIDDQGGIVSFNPAAERMFGYTAQEVMGQNVNVLMPAPYRDEHGSYLAHYLRTGEKRIIGIGREVVGQRQDGTTFPMDLAVSEVVLGDRRLFTGIVRDITERKQAEEALRHERNFMSAILDTIGALVVVLDPEGRIVRFNQACERTTGYTFEVVKGKRVWDFLLLPQDVESVQAIFACLQAGQSPNAHEHVWVSKDGQHRLIAWSSTVLYNEQGGVEYIIGTGLDITERRQAEADRLRLAAIVESSDDAIIGMTLDGTIVSWNRGAEHLYGYTAAEVLGRLNAILMPPDHPNDILDVLARLHRGERIDPYETVRMAKDGRRLDISLSVSSIETEDGAVIGISTIGRDITERKRAAHEMQHADRLALVGQLTSGIAHEIGTPLNVIAGNAEMLRQDLRTYGLPIDVVTSIIEQTDRITGLIQRLLTFARAKPQPMEPLSLHEPLSRALRLLATRFQREVITCIVEMSEELPAIWGAVDQLEQVFLNVLVNAWHAMPNGGTITIQARVLDHEHVQMTIRDTGIGMSDVDLARAFEPFFSTKEDKGTGLGLAMCQQIIQNHHGTIRLESTPGVGTTVTVLLRQAHAF